MAEIRQQSPPAFESHRFGRMEGSLPGASVTHPGRTPEAYVPRRPEESALYRVVADELETFLMCARQRDRTVPRFVEREFRTFLDCGILAHGFLPCAATRTP